MQPQPDSTGKALQKSPADVPYGEGDPLPPLSPDASGKIPTKADRARLSRKELLKELRESERRYASLADQVPAGTAQLRILSEQNDKKLQEITSLYRMSNTILSTMRLDKLVHLILNALTAGDNPFFDRAMLFLISERSSTMQGMLGVTSQTAAGLINPIVELEDILASRWDISEADMTRQQGSEFSRQVRASRLELDKSKNVVSRAVLEKRLIYVADTAKEKRIDCEFVKLFGIKSCAFAPLMAKEKVVGVMIVDNALQGAPISKDDLRFLQLVTNQAGMAIENSILYNRNEDTNRNLREARERLVQGERLSTIGEMAASIAHEVKGPLVSIGGFARRLEKKLPAGSSEYGHATTIVREVERLEKLLTNILLFAKKTTICYATCNVVDIVDECLEIIASTFEEKSIKVIKKYPAKSVILLGDGQQLKQVFLNLFDNALEAMGQGGELRIVVTSTRLNGKKGVLVKVADTGGGIPTKTLHNIFNSFFTTKQAGTGLGLPIANRLVINHGGKIELVNKEGVGAEFNVILPLSP
jgi:signal transduction histidine kinase